MEEQHHIFSEEQRAEIKAIMHDALTEYFSSKGSLLKQILLTAAVIVGAITVIFGGLKTVLGWIGFSYLGK